MSDEFCESGFLPFYLFGHFSICQNPDFYSVNYWDCVNLVRCCCAEVGALAREVIATLLLCMDWQEASSSLFISRLLDPRCSLS